MVTWNWDDEADADGFVHQSVANTDNDDATAGKQGYDLANFSEITPDPIHCYPLHEDSGSTINDVAGTFDGTYSGATLGQQGLLGTTAPDFDGTDDEGTFTSPAIGGTGTDMSVFAWANIDDKTSDNVFVSEWGNAGDSWMLYHSSAASEVRFIVAQSNGTNILPSEPDSSINENDWHCYGGVADTTNNHVRLYLDGSFRVTLAWDGTFDAASDLRIGSHSSAEYINGNAWMVMIFDQVLSESQFQTLENVVRTPGDWLGTGMLL